MHNDNKVLTSQFDKDNVFPLILALCNMKFVIDSSTLNILTHICLITILLSNEESVFQSTNILNFARLEI